MAPHPVPCIRKVSGCLTNAVFFVSSPLTSSRTLLLRVFGPSSSTLISRPRELRVLHALSSKFNLGPRIYGTFTNGRLEEYFDSVTLTSSDIREPRISAYIGARMAELHGVDVATIEGQSHGSNIEIGVRKNVDSWLPHARNVLALPAITPAIRKELDLDRFQTKWENYVQWLKTAGALDARPVFCHNDAQYGNLLRLNKVEENTPEHHQVRVVIPSYLTLSFAYLKPLSRGSGRSVFVSIRKITSRNYAIKQIIVVDFEYASPNPAAFDIANHFHEWTADYHGPTPHVLDPSRYPTHAQRRTFLASYLEHRRATAVKPHAHAHVDEHAPVFSDSSPAARERELVALEKAMCAWGPSSHGMWALWGLVQAREAVVANVAQPEFDYVGYARCRMAAFYRDLAVLGV